MYVSSIRPLPPANRIPAPSPEILSRSTRVFRRPSADIPTSDVRVVSVIVLSSMTTLFAFASAPVAAVRIITSK